MPHPAPANPQGPEDSLKGVLERIIFSNPDSHFCVGELRDEQSATHTVTGTMPNVQCGETLQLTGFWETHPRHGRQFKVRSCQSTLPASVYGIRKYLGSGLVPGIGKTYAAKIVDTFGKDTFSVIEDDSARLREVEGIGPKRAREIKEAWETQRASREVMLFLQTYGVGIRHCLRLVKRYGSEAKNVLLQDPYTTAREIDGIGFKTADQIARNLGFGFASPERLQAGLLHVLREAESSGHTALPRKGLLQTAERLLEVDQPDLEPQLGHLIEQNQLRRVEETDFLQLPASRYREESIAQQLRRIQQGPSGLPPIHIERALLWARQRSRIDFAPEQEEALRSALATKVSILTGGPGTGKTTILRSLVSILAAKKVTLVLGSPTGRAAQRLGESTGCSAATLHRLLRFDPAQARFTVDQEHPLKGRFIIIDEASMLDSALAAALLRGIPTDAHLLLVGDVNQLPSVGSGNVLNDLIEHAGVPVVRLQQIFRQSEHSNIVTTAHALLGGQAGPPRLAPNLKAVDPRFDLQFIAAPEPADCLKAIEELFTTWLPRHLPDFPPLRDVQVLAPMHRGLVGIREINTTLQKRLNPDAASLAFGETVFRVGDRVIQMRNNYDKNIYNGDLGTVLAVHPATGGLTAAFHQREVQLERMELIDLELAYAISIHKSQGSEFPVVVIPLLKQHFILLQRNLLYTAITRGRRKVFLLGDPAAYAMAVRNTDQQKRHTGLPIHLHSPQPPTALLPH